MTANGIDQAPRIAAQDSPAGTVVKDPPTDAGDTGSIPGPRRSHVPKGTLHATATRALMPTACALQQEKPLQREACAWQ